MLNLNQTEIGKIFGYPSVEMGKILCQLGLKDPETKLATAYALDNKLAMNTVTRISAFSHKSIECALWNERIITYIKNKKNEDIEFITQGIIGHIKSIKKNETVQVLAMTQNSNVIYEYFLNSFSLIDNNYQALSILKEKLEKNKLLSYAIEQFKPIQNLDILLNKLYLERLLEKKPLPNHKLKV